MKLIYKPFGILLGVAAGMLGKRLFDAIWKRVDDAKPPKATTRETTVAKLVAASAIQGVIYKVVRVLVDRAGARGWLHLTGTWPGERRPDTA